MVKYTGRLVITIVVLVLFAIIRIYGNMYYNYPTLKFPFIGILALLICWWCGSQYDKIKFYSERDILTKIYNRRYITQKFPKLLMQVGKKNKKLTLFFIDIDNFKNINDTLGHEIGDKVLKYISSILLSNTTKNEIIARWAGDEFLIIYPNSDNEIGNSIIKQIKNALRNSSKEINVDVSVSIGTSVYPNDAKTLESLLSTADREMYKMKSLQKASMHS